MGSSDAIRLATRGSALARKQARVIADALAERRHEVTLVEVETTGDQVRDELIHRLGTTGAFVRSLDERVLDGDVDAAVHSMKDMPTDSPEELIVAGIPERAPPGDRLVTPSGATLTELPSGAVIGTSSLRRRAQLLEMREDIELAPLRGNVDTRIEKLLAPTLQREHERRLTAETEDSEDEDFDRTPEEWFDDLAEIERQALERQPDQEYDAIVLAAAGLERSGLTETVPTVDLPRTDFIPAPGQGAIAVTSLEGSEASELIHDAVDHPRTRVETTVERVILSTIGGGCVAPIGVYAIVQGEQIHTVAKVLSGDGSDVISGTRDLPIRDYVASAREFAEELKDRGASDLIEAARAETSTETKRTE